MNVKFFDLKKEKQDRMINGALKVFALNGYQKASTDDIVKEAGISKGLLFHYFGSKAGVYTFMYEYSARYMTMELSRAVNYRETDLFVLMKQIEDAKAVLLRNYPYMQNFLLTHDTVTDEEILVDIAEHVESVPRTLDEIMERVDASEIADGVDLDLLIRSMNYFTRGLTEIAIAKDMDPDEVQAEAHAYFDMMSKRFKKDAW